MLKAPDVSTALRIYYSHTEIGNPEIKELFKVQSSTTALRLKKRVWEEMVKRKIFTVNPNSVNTKLAFEIWGLDIHELEKNFKKLQQLQIGGVRS